jgi:hypothetical protein
LVEYSPCFEVLCVHSVSLFFFVFASRPLSQHPLFTLSLVQAAAVSCFHLALPLFTVSSSPGVDSFIMSRPTIYIGMRIRNARTTGAYKTVVRGAVHSSFNTPLISQASIFALIRCPTLTGHSESTARGPTSAFALQRGPPWQRGFCEFSLLEFSDRCQDRETCLEVVGIIGTEPLNLLVVVPSRRAGNEE